MGVGLRRARHYNRLITNNHTDYKAMPVTRVNIPSWFRCAFPLQIANAPAIGATGKIAAIHALDAEIAHTEKFYRGYTHLPLFFENTLTAAQRCYVLLSDVFAGVGHSDGQINAAADSVATRVNAQSCFGDQFAEGGANVVPHDGYFVVAEKFYRRLCQTLGVAGASAHNWMCTYDTKNANFGEYFKVYNGSGNVDPLHPYYVGALASQTGARKKGAIENGVQKEDPFFTSGLHQWTNAFTMALWANDLDVKHWLFSWIFEAQRKYASKIDFTTVVYTSPWTQSLATPVNEHHKNPGWVRERTGGYWKTPNWHILPMEMALWCGFFGCLLTEGVYMWDAGLNFSNNIANDRIDPYAPAETWVSTGGAEPVRQAYGEPYYPKFPRTGADAIMVGVHWYNAIKHIVNASSGIAYAPYTANGVAVGIQPGDPRLFRRGFQNFGQDTILHHANAQRGTAFACSGAGETLLVYINPYNPVSKKEAVTITFNNVAHNLGNLEGATLHVFRAS